jgi:hypothetical protein
MAQATSGDDVLTVLYGTDPLTWGATLAGASLPLLRSAADLCGVAYADTMTRKQATRAIEASF